MKFSARLAGFLFLWLIVTGVTGMVMTSRIAGSGTFAEKAQRVVASEHLYRLALTSDLIETLSALLLAFALYATLKPVDELLARLGMYWRFAEAFIGCIGVTFGFLKLHLYTSPVTAQSQPLLDLLRNAGSISTNIGALCFSLGSLLFFYLFYKSAYIPRFLGGFGMFASVVVTVMCFGMLLFPEHGSTLQYGWAPMAIAEVTTGVWLMVFGVRSA